MERICSNCKIAKPMSEFHGPTHYWCRLCANSEAKTRRYNNREKYRQLAHKYYGQHIQTIRSKARKRMKEIRSKYPERIKVWKHADYIRRKEHIRKKNKVWYEQHKEQHIAVCRKWCSTNKEKVRIYSIRKAIRRRTRVPKWADMEAIDQFYRNCPIGMTVDHIVPLCGKTVSGLHVLSNLQYLTLKDNIKKSNSYPWQDNN